MSNEELNNGENNAISISGSSGCYETVIDVNNQNVI